MGGEAGASCLLKRAHYFQMVLNHYFEHGVKEKKCEKEEKDRQAKAEKKPKVFKRCLLQYLVQHLERTLASETAAASLPAEPQLELR